MYNISEQHSGIFNLNSDYQGLISVKTHTKKTFLYHLNENTETLSITHTCSHNQEIRDCNEIKGFYCSRDAMLFFTSLISLLPTPLLSYILPLTARSNFTRSTSESWKSFLWKEAICLKHSAPSRSEMLPSVFSLPRCIASSKYLGIKWQTGRAARELQFSGKAQLRGKLCPSDIGDLSKKRSCFGLSMFCNASVVFFVYLKSIHNFRRSCCGVAFL